VFSVCGEFVADYFFCGAVYCGCRFGGAGGAVARASGLRCAIFESRHLFAGLLNGAFDTQFAHVFVGGNFGVDVVSLENQGERHGQDEKSDGQNRQKNYD